jgi:hypothetical protein
MPKLLCVAPTLTAAAAAAAAAATAGKAKAKAEHLAAIRAHLLLLLPSFV